MGQDYIPHDISTTEHGVDLTLKLLDSPEDSDIFDSAVQLLLAMSAVPEVVSVFAKCDPPCMWRVIRILCVKGGSPVISHLWKCVDAMVSNPDALEAMMRFF